MFKGTMEGFDIAWCNDSLDGFFLRDHRLRVCEPNDRADAQILFFTNTCTEVGVASVSRWLTLLSLASEPDVVRLKYSNPSLNLFLSD